MRSGFVPVVGRPNVGKSTLVNAMVGEKVSIVSTRPQTTRNRIRGIINGVDHQIVLIDTPGLHKPRTELGHRLNAGVYRTLGEADAVLFVIDATQPIGPGDRMVAARLRDNQAEVLVALNKVDIASRTQIAEQLLEAGAWDFSAYLPVAARTSIGLAPLLAELVERMPEAPPYFPPGEASDLPEHVLVGELIREKFLDHLRDELPHSLIVVVDDMQAEESGMLIISARAVVERDSQKGIVIGKGGVMLATAGTAARHELETLFGVKVHLDLRVVVEDEWQRRPDLLDRFGFSAGDE
jgi:GTP-binding protein Era